MMGRLDRDQGQFSIASILTRSFRKIIWCGPSRLSSTCLGCTASWRLSEVHRHSSRVVGGQALGDSAPPQLVIVVEIAGAWPGLIMREPQADTHARGSMSAARGVRWPDRRLNPKSGIGRRPIPPQC
jgi:hypothetical protein